MGKKKGGGRKGAAAEADYDDAGSLCSSSTAACSMGEAAEYGDPAAAAFSEAIDDTYESRASTRERAWEALVALLRNNVRSDDCYQSAQTLTDRCLSAIRKGGAAEAASAATALALHVITLGEPNEVLFQEALPELVRATKHGKGPALKAAAADALALTCFVAAEDESTTLESMQHLQALWRKDGVKLRAAALRGWALLYTSLSAPLGSRQLEATMATLGELLHDSEVEVRTAAGEGLALLFHTSGLADGDADEGWRDDDDDEYDDDDEEHGMSGCSLAAAAVNGWQQQPTAAAVDAAAAAATAAEVAAGMACLGVQSPVQSPVQQQQQPAAAAIAAAAVGGSGEPPTSPVLSPAAAAAADTVAAVSKQAAAAAVQRRRDGDDMSLVSCSSVSGLDLVVDRMRDLAANRGDRQRRSKRERAALRGAFRDLKGVMEDGRVPELKIKLRHGDTLLVDSLEGVTMMNCLKRFLAGGFQVHLQGNPFLHAVFGFTPLDARPERLSAQEKRAFRSPCSAASKARSQARRSQRAFKGAPGGGDW